MNVSYKAPQLTRAWSSNLVKPEIRPDNLPIITTANQRDPTMIMYPCKSLPELTRTLRKPPMPDTGAFRPTFGKARNEAKGLAYDSDIPIDRPVMPPPPSFSSVGYTRLI